MSQSFHSIWVHLVWATKYRAPIIKPDLKIHLIQQFKTISINRRCHLDFTNGVEDHVHLLMCLNPDVKISRIVNDLKGITHDWIRDQNLCNEYFHWQDGYAAISVSPDRVPIVRNYIRNQELHHRKTPFLTEWESYEKLGAIYKK